jgi:hypothetical protein
MFAVSPSGHRKSDHPTVLMSANAYIMAERSGGSSAASSGRAPRAAADHVRHFVQSYARVRAASHAITANY